MAVTWYNCVDMIPIKKRFWSKVKKGKGCWEWQGAKLIDGYGLFYLDSENRTYRVHRLSWEFVNGKIPKKLLVLHKCDNPPCIRPSHLFLGTNMDNTQDQLKKGRLIVGENHSQAKLTQGKIIKIRKLYKQRNTSYAKLAKKFRVNSTTIAQIIRYEAWKHIR